VNSGGGDCHDFFFPSLFFHPPLFTSCCRRRARVGVSVGVSLDPPPPFFFLTLLVCSVGPKVELALASSFFFHGALFPRFAPLPAKIYRTAVAFSLPRLLSPGDQDAAPQKSPGRTVFLSSSVPLSFFSFHAGEARHKLGIATPSFFLAASLPTAFFSLPLPSHRVAGLSSSSPSPSFFFRTWPALRTVGAGGASFSPLTFPSLTSQAGCGQNRSRRRGVTPFLLLRSSSFFLFSRSQPRRISVPPR